MRLHRNLVFAVIDALSMIFEENMYADKVIDKVLKQDKRWGSRDRGFIAETTYDIVRWKRLYAEIAEVKEPFSRQDLFRLFSVWAVLRGLPLPDWKQFEATPTRRIKGRFDLLGKTRKIRESIPDWLDALGENSLGNERWTKEIAAMNQQAKVVLRANTLKTNRKKLQRELAEEGFETQEVPNYPDALQLVRRQNVFKSQAFSEGFFEVQDAASQLIAPFVEAAPGQRVVDTCAGAGGKTLHLAAQMQNKGQIIAMDIYGSKLKELKRRAKRNGAHNIETRIIASSKDIKKLYEKCDRVLIDAPCTGLGVLRRNPDTKWKLQPDFLEKVKATQAEILKSYCSMVKPGGKLIYATCSILPEENQEQIARFLETDAGANFKCVAERQVFASDAGYDGFYMARLHKK